MTENIIKGYLDVKISSRGRRGFTPWKAWQRQWCELRRVDDSEVGLELKLKSAQGGTLLNCIQLPRCATLCRTDSKSKQYAFGVFNFSQAKTKKAMLFLAGSSESNSQEWIFSIRRMLSVANYIPIGESNFQISLVDTSHSRSAGLLGLYGVLNANSQEIMISDPCTGALKASWKWYCFHQFHMQATSEASDDEKVVVMHTSKEFSAGPGQLILYCPKAPQLLHYLISRGHGARFTSSLFDSKRWSHSEGDLVSGSLSGTPDSPPCFCSQASSDDDSGVPNSLISVSEFAIKIKADSNLINLVNEVTKTPGGSETEDSCPDLSDNFKIPRNESGVSLASGVYEEIPEDYISKSEKHIYENPIELLQSRYFQAPPLPPRTFFTLERLKPISALRCNTLPAKDLSQISQLFNFAPQKSIEVENEYVVMSPCKTLEKIIAKENFYVPMSSPIRQKKIVEGGNCNDQKA